VNKFSTGLLLILALNLFASEYNTPYQQGALGLADQIKKTIAVSIGNFVYEDTKLMSPFSSLLRDELKTALASTGKFKIISRERLNDLLKEKRFQNMNIFDPGHEKIKIKLNNIDAIVRGRFYYRYPYITVFTELVWFDGGETKSTKIVLNENNVHTEILPINLKKSKKNIVDIRNQIKKIPHDFNIELATVDLKRSFKSGEKIRFKIRSAKNCNIAVFCHQSDGSTVLLFPNNWNDNTLIKANSDVFIPENTNKNFEIEVGPPFGSDIVQVIASTQASELHRKMSELVQAHSSYKYCDITRGLFAKAVDRSVPNNQKFNNRRLWSEAHIIISTYAK